MGQRFLLPELCQLNTDHHCASSFVALSRQLGVGLRPRESYHLARKTFHFSTIMAFATLYSAKLPRWDFARGMAALDVCVLAGELARLRVQWINKLLLRCAVCFIEAISYNIVQFVDLTIIVESRTRDLKILSFFCFFSFANTVVAGVSTTAPPPPVCLLVAGRGSTQISSVTHP